MTGVRNKAIILSAVVIIAAVFFVAPFSQEQVTGIVNDKDAVKSNVDTLFLSTKTNEGNGLTIDVTPINFILGKPIVFDISLNTHTGSLDFDPVDISVLTDSRGKIYYAIKWIGPEPGGHHKSGKLEFPALDEKSSSMTLTMKDVYGVPERIFTWELVGG